MRIHLRAPTPADHVAIAALVTEAFTLAYPDSPGGEAQIIEGVRAEGRALVELLAETADGGIVGHILFSRMTCDPPALAAGLAPVAVSPALQGQGICARLCREGLDLCRARGAVAAVVLGSPAYYPRFGFSRAAALPLACRYGALPAFMAMELAPGGLAGLREVAYPAAFG